MGVPLKDLWYNDTHMILEFSKQTASNTSHYLHSHDWLTPLGNQMLRILMTLFPGIVVGDEKKANKLELQGTHTIKIARHAAIEGLTRSELKKRMASLDKKLSPKVEVVSEEAINNMRDPKVEVYMYICTHLSFTFLDMGRLRNELSKFQNASVLRRVQADVRVGFYLDPAKATTYQKPGRLAIIFTFTNATKPSERKKVLKHFASMVRKSKDLN